jgi:5,10-methylenetetrahydromethanopterin reductase
MAPHLHRAQRIGPAALNPYLMHPVELAGQAALLDLATDGRAYLGLARGAWLQDRLGIDQARPVTALREAVLLIRHLLAGRAEPFRGKVFSCAERSVLQYPRRRCAVPISIGTWGPATARMAGELADELKVGGSANPALVAHLRPTLAEGSQRAGRAADAVGICLGAVTVIDDDRQAARALARREVAPYLSVVAKLDPSTDPEWLGRIEDAAHRNDYDCIASNVSDAVLDRFTFAGNADDLIRQVETIFDAGATRVEFGTPLGRQPHVALRVLGERVLPAFGRP